MLTKYIFGVLSFLAAAAFSVSAHAGTEVVKSTTDVAGTPFENIYMPCISETAHFTGSLDSTISQTAQSDGSFTVKLTFRPDGLTGVTPSGVVYRGAGSTVLTATYYPDGTVAKSIENSTFFIGRGPNNDLKDISHISATFDSAGHLTSITQLTPNTGSTCGVGG